MQLFGPRFARGTPFIDPMMAMAGDGPPMMQAPQQDAASKMSAPRRGLFGRMGSGLMDTVSGRQHAPNALDFFLMGPRGVRQMRRQDFLMSQAEQEAKLAAQGRDDMNSAIGQLPPEMQAWGRLAPEAVAQSMFRQRTPQEPHYDSSTGNFWGVGEDGRPQVLGRMPGWQRTQGGGGGDQGRPPAGYRYTQDGNLEPIPGGPADYRQSEAGRTRAAQMDASERSLDNALAALDRAGRLTSWDSTGAVGGIMRNAGGTRAYDLQQALEPVRAILSFENLAEMRRNSQTGGALGSIAVRELELLGSTVASLDTAQSTPEFQRSIQTVRAQLQRTQAAIRRAREEMNGGGQQPQQGGGQQPRVIELDPQR